MSTYFPYLIAFLAMSGYATLGTLTKKAGQFGLDGAALIFVNSISLALFCLITFLFLPKQEVFRTLPLEGWAWAIGAAFVNFVAFALYVWAINNVPVVEYQIMYLASPIIAATLAFLLLSEPIALKHIIGGSIVALGVYIAVR